MLLRLPFRVRSTFQDRHRLHIPFLSSTAAHVNSQKMAPPREVIEIEDSSEYEDEDEDEDGDAFSSELLNLDNSPNDGLGRVDPAYYGFGHTRDAQVRQDSIPNLPTQPPPSFEDCLARVIEVYPDICHDHVRRLYEVQVLPFHSQAGIDPQDQISQLLIVQILDADKYPKERDRRKELKRKRSIALDSDEEEAATWTAAERAVYPDEYSKQALVFPRLRFSHSLVMIAFTLFVQISCMAV